MLPTSCDCENIPVSLTEIPNPSCKQSIGQILRAWFVRAGEVIWDSATPANNIPATIVNDEIHEAVGWATLFAASNATKVVKTQQVGGNPVITPGTPITQGGGDNSTANGATIIRGTTPSVFSAEFFDLHKDTITAMRKLFCEEQLEVYFINHEGKILHKKDGDLLTGFAVKNVYLAPKNNAGLNTSDSNAFSFELEKGWDEFLAFATPESGFNTLTI